MAEASGMAGMLLLAFLALVATYIIMRIIGRPSNDEVEGEEEAVAMPVPKQAKKPEMISDEEFISSYTGPILEDAHDSLETAVESILSALHFYDKGSWEEASEEFHSAIKRIDEAAERLNEVVEMVEDDSSRPVLLAKRRLEECRRLRTLAIRMEEACDAMIEGKVEEAKGLDIVKPELEKIAREWHASI